MDLLKGDVNFITFFKYDEYFHHFRCSYLRINLYFAEWCFFCKINDVDDDNIFVVMQG